MRIRKNAKESPLLHTNSEMPIDYTLPETQDCQLNQSMWDVIPLTALNSLSFQNLQVNGEKNKNKDPINSPLSKPSKKRNVHGRVSGELCIKREDCSAPLPPKSKETRDSDEVELLCPVTDSDGWPCAQVCQPSKGKCNVHIELDENPYAVNYKWTSARREKKIKIEK